MTGLFLSFISSLLAVLRYKTEKLMKQKLDSWRFVLLHH